MSNKHKFIGSIISVLKHNKDGSYRSQNDRADYLITMGKQLYKDGYQLSNVRQLKAKHIWHLLEGWKSSDVVTPGSMKIRLSHIRWLLRKIGKANMLPSSNDDFNIPKRQMVKGIDKSRELTELDLKKTSSGRLKLILQSQVLFGLRLEESLKLQPFMCDLGGHLHVVKTKGGRERYVPIHSQEQREWLKKMKLLVKDPGASLIPQDTSYITYRRRIQKALQRAGIFNVHGHRHMYAHKRFEALAGYPCPVKGGPKTNELTKEQLAIDRKARLQLSFEMGHSRSQITKVYCM